MSNQQIKGGEIPPFRINFIALGCAPHDLLVERAKACSAPYVKPRNSARLAVVGLGDSAKEALPDLLTWDGDIWAVNGAASWLASNGICATMVTVDPQKFVAGSFDGVESAIFASCADPEAFSAMHGRVEKFDLCEHADNGVVGGCTTASRIPALAIGLGFKEVTFFGCEGSFVGSDHLNFNTGNDGQLIVKAGDFEYKTMPEWILQCQSLAHLIAEWPEIFKERCGGLLRGMLNDPNWSVVAVSATIKEQIETVSGACGLYEVPYQQEQSCNS